MKKTIFIVLAISMLLSCNAKNVSKNKYVHLWGKVKNHDPDVKYLELRVFSIMSKYAYSGWHIDLDKEGYFDTYLDIKQSDYFSITYLATTLIYLKKGTDLKLEINNIYTLSDMCNNDKYDNSDNIKTLQIHFEGETAKINDYINEKNKFQDKNNYFPQNDELYELILQEEKSLKKEKKWLEKLQKYKADLDKLLKNSGIKDKSFLEGESKMNFYSYLSILNQKTSFREGYSINPYIYTYFEKLLPKVDFNDTIAFKNDLTHDYQNLIRFLIQKNLPDACDQEVLSECVKYTIPLFFKKLKKGMIRDEFTFRMMFGFIRTIKKKSEMDENMNLYNMVVDSLDKKSYKEDLERIYHDKLLVFKGIKKGATSPTFKDYENYKGGTMSLSDFKGKYLFIHAWVPC
jgi:hypothetical protein